MTSPKSQNGNLVTSLDVLSASNAAQPPSLDCMPINQRVARAAAAHAFQFLGNEACLPTLAQINEAHARFDERRREGKRLIIAQSGQ